MKTRTSFSPLLALGGLLLAVTTSAQPLTAEDSIALPVQSDSTVRSEADTQPLPDSTVELTPHDTSPSLSQTLLSTSAVVGVAVKNSQGETLGHIQELMLDPQSGRVLYALVTCAGFLGVSKKSLAIPWGTLKVGLDQTVVIAELKTDSLSVPSHALLSHR